MSSLKHFISGIILAGVLTACGGSRQTSAYLKDVEVNDFYRAVAMSYDTSEAFYFSGSGKLTSKGKASPFQYRMVLYRDSLIWVDLMDPFLGLKLARMLIEPDSVKGYIHFKKTWTAAGYSELRQSVLYDLDFSQLQRALLADPVYVSPDRENVQISVDSLKLTALVSGRQATNMADSSFRESFAYQFGNRVQFPLQNQILYKDGFNIVLEYGYGDSDGQTPNFVRLTLGGDKIEFRHSEVHKNEKFRTPFAIPEGYEYFE